MRPAALRRAAEPAAAAATTERLGGILARLGEPAEGVTRLIRGAVELANALARVARGLADPLERLAALAERADVARGLAGRVADLLDFLAGRSEEHTSELQSRENLVCRLLLE